MQWLEQHWYRITPMHLILLPISCIFYLLVVIRRALYRSKVLTSVKLPVPVIIVGNVTVGGNGKTPLTLWLAKQLLDNGQHPGIISRGYGGKNSSPRVVYPSTNPDEAGDEAVLMARRRLCPVWIGHDRAGAARALLRAHPECNVLISDDGMQHYRLQRDFEIAVVDGIRRWGNGFLLPAGSLREPISRLDEVDAVVINGGMAAKGQYSMQLQGEIFYNLVNPDCSAHAASFYGQRLHSIAGIGYPQRFFNYLEQLGLQVENHPFPDHYSYTLADLDYPDADAIFMTEKDAVKCIKFANEKCWVLRVDAQLDSLLVQQILERLLPDAHQTA